MTPARRRGTRGISMTGCIGVSLWSRALTRGRGVRGATAFGLATHYRDGCEVGRRAVATAPTGVGLGGRPGRPRWAACTSIGVAAVEALQLPLHAIQRLFRRGSARHGLARVLVKDIRQLGVVRRRRNRPRARAVERLVEHLPVLGAGG